MITLSMQYCIANDVMHIQYTFPV